MRLAMCALIFTACASPETDLEESFCALLADRPARSVDAVSDGGGPDVAVEDERVDIALVDGGGTWSGTVAFTADEAGSFAIGLDSDVPITVLDARGTELPWEAEVAGAGCAALAVRYTVALDIETVTLELGPTDREVVGMVSEESDDDL